MVDISERVEEAWTELASRLDLTGKHCGWFKSWLTEIVRRERAQALREAADTFASTDGYVYAMKHGDPGATIRERVIDWLRARAAEEGEG